MSDFDFGQFSGGMDFSPFSEETKAVSGPYIPEQRDCLGCGVCLGSCPTYRVKQEEMLAPRGRVRMIEKVLRKGEALGQEELEALGACTLCRACETVCPSKMAYADLYHQAMDAITDKPSKSLVIRLLLDFVVSRRLSQRVMSKLIYLYQRSGLQRSLKLLPFSLLKGGAKQLEKLLPVPYVHQSASDYSQATTEVPHGNVALFTGCVANIFDTETHNATIEIVTRLGYDVVVPQNQTCCGAVYDHHGEVEQAKTCARKNVEVFARDDIDSVLYNSSGCGAFLSEYPALLTDKEGGARGELLLVDVMDILMGSQGMNELKFCELKTTVAVHEPCSQRNVLKNHEVVYQLLAKIPGLNVMALPGNTMCCGAGGTKMVTQPEMAEPLRDEKVTSLLECGADMLISTNLNCALHLGSGIREAGHRIEVMHPVRLLAQQLI